MMAGLVKQPKNMARSRMRPGLGLDVLQDIQLKNVPWGA